MTEGHSDLGTPTADKANKAVEVYDLVLLYLWEVFAPRYTVIWIEFAGHSPR